MPTNKEVRSTAHNYSDLKDKFIHLKYVNKGYEDTEAIELETTTNCLSTIDKAWKPPSKLHSKSDFKEEFVNVTYVNKGFEDTEDITIETSNNGKIPEKAEEEEKDESPDVGFFELFRYSSRCDRILIIIGILIAILSGLSLPMVMVIYGKVMDRLIVYDIENKISTNQTITTELFLHETANLCRLLTAVGVAFSFLNYIMVSFFSLAAANQAFKIKSMFMASILKQDIGWYDTTKTGDFASRITGDLARIQDGIGEKVCICISFIFSMLFSVGTGMWYSWKLTLVTLSITPIMAISVAFMSKVQASVSREEMQAYGMAGAVAEEVLSAIRTVVSFGGENKEIQRYDNCLVPARKKGINRGFITAIMDCLSWICTFAGYSLAFWYGVKLILEGSLTGGELTIVFFNVLYASMYIGLTAPYFEAFGLARGSAAKIYAIIDRIPLIDSSSKEGKRPGSVTGAINIRDIFFNYPARPTVPVLKGVSLNVQPGETVALVGPSGCGKSTIVQLILRFYDTDQGAIKLDENNVKDLNVGWLRDHIGIVGQEPVLFSTTIAENIRYGKWDATENEIENAAKVASAHEFIQALPLKYATLVGERGTQLSGGQKQRIAIARAVIKNPKILLLDEATSALDTESEAVVQAALDKARHGRTTIVVAHRLSTIRTADKIVVLSEGEVKEVGTHGELMKKEGIYYHLVQTQAKPTKEDEDNELNQVYKKEECLISELGSKLSVLSRGTANRHSRSENRQPLLARRRSSEKVTAKLSSLKKIGYDKKPRNASERQTSLDGDGKDIGDVDVDDELDKKAYVPQARLWKVSASEWPYALVGGTAAFLMGLHFPAFGIIFGSILGVLSDDPRKIADETYVFCLLYLLMALTSGICSFLKVFMFSVAGENLTSRLRKMVFSNIITQDIEFFDHPKNSVGSLCSRLTSDASNVQGATGSRVSVLVQATSTLLATIVLALWYNYKIGLVALAFLPCTLIGTYFESLVIAGQSTTEKLGTEDALKVAIEAIESIRTVASLHQEETFFIKFQNFLLGPHKNSRKQSHVRGLIYGLSQGIPAFTDAATLYYGSILVANKEIHFSDLMKILEGVMFSAMMVGEAVAFAPDYQKAKLSTVRIFRLLDLKPKIDAFSVAGKKLENVNGCIRFDKVNFTYPNRPTAKVLTDLDVEIEPGKTVALVGSSGCGKSTCVQLIERFYDPQSGSVFVDNTKVGDMNVSNLRSHVGLVSQEPVLFSYSIAENIAYGDNSRQVKMDEIIEAARKANIHNFITKLPQGYHTPVGDKGTQLSGGQKQRVAIARALLRNPKILLLDEATSALDAESEKIVQDALDKARSGRTCLIIAHRLTTIQNADVIMVIHKGRIVEKGTHQELLNKKGHYYNLHNTQASTE